MVGVLNASEPLVPADVKSALISRSNLTWKVPDLVFTVAVKSQHTVKQKLTVENWPKAVWPLNTGGFIGAAHVVLSGAKPGLVPADASHVAGQQRRRRGAERDQKPAGETGVHHETGVQPVGPADRAEGTGGSN